MSVQSNIDSFKSKRLSQIGSTVEQAMVNLEDVLQGLEDNKAEKTYVAQSFVDVSNALNLKADLVNGVVKSEQLPAFVKNIENAYYYNNQFYDDEAHTILITPSAETIYVDITGGGTNQYRWSGTAYVLMGTGQLVTITTDGLMTYLDKVKLNGIAEGATKVELSTTNGNIKVNDTEFQVYRLSDNEVTNVKLAKMPTKTFKGNKETTTENAQDLTITEAQDLIFSDDNHLPVSLAEKTQWNATTSLVKIYNTVAEMQADSANITTGMTIQLLGYYIKNDGAGHMRKIESSDDGSGIAVGGLWANIVLKEFNPIHFGAKGNGVDLDTVFFIKLFNTILNSTNENIEIIFPCSYVFKIQGEFSILNKKKIYIHGKGTIKNGYETANNFKFLTINNCEDVVIKNLTCDYNKQPYNFFDVKNIKNGVDFNKIKFLNTGNYAQNSIILENIGASNSNYESSTFNITECHFSNYSTLDTYHDNVDRGGVHIVLNSHAEYGHISKNHFFNIKTAIKSTGGANTTVVENSFYCSGVYQQYPIIDCVNSGSNYGKHIIALNNFNHNNGQCIQWDAQNINLLINDNNFIVNTDTAIWLTGSKNATIDNNYFSNLEKDLALIAMNGSQKTKITNNTFVPFGNTHSIESFGITNNTVIHENIFEKGNPYSLVDIVKDIKNNFGDNNNDQDWVDLTLLNGWKNSGISNYANAQIKKIDNHVYIKGFIKGGTTTEWTVIANLPLKYRPNRNVCVSALSNLGTTFLQVTVPTGNLEFGNFPVGNTWFNIEMDYKIK